METQIKHCPRCGEDKPIDQFGLNKSKKDGHADYCRVCQNEISREQYLKGKARKENNTVQPKTRMPEGIKKEEKPNLITVPTADLVDALRGRGVTVLVNPKPKDLMKKLVDFGYTGTLEYTIKQTVSLSTIND